jgi:hypothetical protein
MGDNFLFEEKVKFAKEWFASNKVPIPSGAKEWSKKSVSKGEIPPGCTYQTLYRNNINLSDFIAAITNTESNKVTYDPVNNHNCVEKTGLIWLNHEVINSHKKVYTECSECTHTEVLDYGTLQRMVKAGSKLCRNCRNVGGKRKDLSQYDKFEDFQILEFKESNIIFRCNSCSNTISRGLDYTKTAEYLVCEYCSPNNKITKVNTELGTFDSKIEYLVYKYLLTVFDPQDIEQQPTYKELFGLATKHRGDFYIKPLDILLEVTTKNNNIKSSYHNNLNFKLGISNKVKLVTSIKEVKDIVQPLMKVNG